MPTGGLSREHMCGRQRVLDWWNSGEALDPESEIALKYDEDSSKRARHDANAKSHFIRERFSGRGIA